MTPEEAGTEAAALAGKDEGEKQSLNQWLTDLQDNPNAIASMLTFAGGLLQPKQTGDTSAGIFGRALAGATKTFTDLQRQTEQGERAQEGLDQAAAALPSQNLARVASAGQAMRSPTAGRGTGAALEAQRKQHVFVNFAQHYGLLNEDGSPTPEAYVRFEEFMDPDVGANTEAAQLRNLWMKQAETFMLLNDNMKQDAETGVTTGALQEPTATKPIPPDADPAEAAKIHAADPTWYQKQGFDKGEWLELVMEGK
jgi:hypothetical protein